MSYIHFSFKLLPNSFSFHTWRKFYSGKNDLRSWQGQSALCKVSCLYKKIANGLFVTFTRTVNKICLNLNLSLIEPNKALFEFLLTPNGEKVAKK